MDPVKYSLNLFRLVGCKTSYQANFKNRLSKVLSLINAYILLQFLVMILDYLVNNFRSFILNSDVFSFFGITFLAFLEFIIFHRKRNLLGKVLADLDSLDENGKFENLLSEASIIHSWKWFFSTVTAGTSCVLEAINKFTMKMAKLRINFAIVTARAGTRDSDSGWISIEVKNLAPKTKISSQNQAPLFGALFSLGACVNFTRCTRLPPALVTAISSFIRTVASYLKSDTRKLPTEFS